MGRKIIARCLLVVIGLLSCVISFAQDKSVEMADTMRSNGKIYIVVAVCLTILIGMFLYMTMLDRKIGKLEKNRNAE